MTRLCHCKHTICEIEKQLVENPNVTQHHRPYAVDTCDNLPVTQLAKVSVGIYALLIFDAYKN